MYRIIITIILNCILFFIIFKNVIRKTPIISDPIEWWGPGMPNKIDKNIYDFHINVSNKVITDFYERLNNSRPIHEPSKFLRYYGVNQGLANYIQNTFKTQYNWDERLKVIKQFPHYRTNIRGLNIHFVHVKPKEIPCGVKLLPLLLIHGWPGSFIEFYRMIPLLTSVPSGSDFTFEVFVPSLPGFGFSDPATKLGMNPAEIAHIFKDLMFRLGHRRFYVHGGDVGSFIARDMAIIYPEAILGLHRSWCPDLNMFEDWKIKYRFFVEYFLFTQEDINLLGDNELAIDDHFKKTGAFHLMATRPETIGTALTDSPLGLAAFMLDPFISIHSYTLIVNLTTTFDVSQLLDNVMIYWITNSITTSMRIFAEYNQPKYEDMMMDETYITVPAGCDRFFDDFFFPPEVFLKKHEKLIHLYTHYQGGHYSAFELPEVLSEDIFEFVYKVRDLKFQIFVS